MLHRIKVNIQIFLINGNLYSKNSILFLCYPSKYKQFFIFLFLGLNLKHLSLFPIFKNA